MSEYYLMHSGRSKRDGAKIGSGRYPLGSGERPFQGEDNKSQRLKFLRKKKSAPEKKEETVPEKPFTDDDKKRIIDSGNIKEAFKYREHFTNNDIDAVINRYKKENELKALTVKNVKTGQEKVEKMTSVLKTGIGFANEGINAYNVVARLVNTFSDNEMPVVLAVGSQPAKKKPS